MKGVFALAVVATVVAVAVGAPITQDVDWAKVSSKVDQLEAGVNGGIAGIITTAKRDNSKVGDEIEEKLNVPVLEAQVVVEQARVAIRANLLTPERARYFFAQLEGILARAEADLEEDLEKLSRSASDTITELFDYIRQVAGRTANEIYELLEDAAQGKANY